MGPGKGSSVVEHPPAHPCMITIVRANQRLGNTRNEVLVMFKMSSVLHVARIFLKKIGMRYVHLHLERCSKVREEEEEEHGSKEPQVWKGERKDVETALGPAEFACNWFPLNFSCDTLHYCKRPNYY